MGDEETIEMCCWWRSKQLNRVGWKNCVGVGGGNNKNGLVVMEERIESCW